MKRLSMKQRARLERRAAQVFKRARQRARRTRSEVSGIEHDIILFLCGYFAHKIFGKQKAKEIGF